MPRFGGYDFALVVGLLDDQVYLSVTMHQTHHRGGHHQDTPPRVILCLMGTQRQKFRQVPQSTLRHWLVQETPEVRQYPSVYAGSLHLYEYSPM